jgi:hypothetical protein
MKTSRIVIAVAVALCAAQAFSATHTEVTTAPRLPFLRGMGFDGYYENRNRTWMTQPGVYSGLVAKGFDHVRLPVDFRTYSTYDSSTGDATLKETTSNGWGPGFSTFDTVITNAINAGLYITLDFHGWFDIDPTNQTHRAQFKAYWKAVAERYKDYPNKLIFELANEPRASISYSSQLNSLQKETVSIIRQTNPTRLILYAVPDANQPWALTQAATPPKYGWVSYPANDNNLALVIHCYNPGEFTHQGETWANPSYTTQVRLTDSHRTTLNWDLNQLTLYSKDHDIPIVMNEYNVSHKLADHGDVTEYLSIVTRYCESNGIPWSPWIYYSSSGSGFDCFSGYGANASMIDYVEAGLFPDLTTTDKFTTNMYAKAVDITFSGYSGSSALANFPVLVKLSEAGIYGFHYSDFATTNGFDLCFTDTSGKLLAHEIDTWNPNGVSTVWVKIPSLTASTKIVARYGCANKPIVPKVESVWDSDYVGVWHMGEQKLPLADSTGVSRDITSADGTGIGYGAAGIIGGAVDFGAPGGSRCVNTDDHKELDGFQKMTIEAWTYQTARPTGSDKNTGILGKRTSSSSEASYYIYDSGADEKSAFYVASSGSSPQAAGKVVPTALNTWNHQVHTFDGSVSSDNAKGYLNGVYKGAGTANVSQIFAGAAEFHIGNFQSGDSRNFPGKIDEVRISKTVRSADWIQASYETVAKSNFATYAVEGVEPPPEPQTVEYGPLATSAFAKSMSIRFDVIQAGVTLTNFPVLVKLSTAIDGFSYADFKKANGGDLRFADPDGNLVPHEIDTWNESGVSTVWVKIPRLTRNTIISAYYGCAGSVPAVNAKDVWDDDYVGVWHLGESVLPMKESSETSSDFESKFGDTIGYAAPGIVGGSVDFPTNGTYNALVAPDHDALDGFTKFTLESWTFQNEHKTNAGILAKRKEYNNECAYYIYDVIGDSMCVPLCIGTNRTASARWSYNMTQPMGQWNHIAFTVDMASTAKNIRGYMNGAKGSWEPDVTFFGQMGNCASDLYLGNLGANKKDYSFNGKIDEVRISKCVRSTAWLKATYDTIANPAFATYAVGTVLEPENIDISEVKLKARTDKDNPIDYVEGEPIRFDFWLDGVEALPAEIRGRQPCYVIWTRTADDGVTVKGTNTISLTEGFSVTTSLAIPGIIKMTGTLVGSDYKAFEYYDSSNSKKNVTFGGGAGVATEKMQLSTVEPADFDQFWAEAKAKLATVPFEGNVELVDITPSGAANNFTIYAAKVPCFGPRPVTGWVTIPKNVPAGGLPIQASFDGYGCVTAIPKAPTWGYSTNVHFHINAHGYDVVNRDNKYYQDFNDYINKTNRTFNGTTYGYALAPQDYDNPTNTYFYYMAMRVMRAFQYLKSRPEWNGRDVIASGGSQGGLQTMWAGGLVDGITEIKPSITWGCDIGCPFNGNGNPYPSRTWGIPSVPGAYYFDSALHARRVPRDCIANITRIGMGDYTCPPRGVLLSYYNMKCAVSAYLVQGSDHGYSPPPPNQTFTISKEAAAAPASVFASDAAGFDYTNRVVTVTNATAGATLTLTAMASDGTTTAATATVDENGEATFDIATTAGTAYDYAVASGDDTIAVGGFFTGGWDVGGTWFSAAATNGVSVVSGGAWLDTPTVADRKYAVDGTADFVLSSDAAAAGSNRFVRVDFGYVFNSFCDTANLSDEGEEAIGGFTAAVNAKGDKLWMAYGDNGWVSLYGDIAPTEEQEYVVRAEADFAADSPRVRYEVSADAGAAFAPLYIDEGYTERWVTGAAQARSVTGVEFDGQGSVASLFGSLANANVAEADGVGYASLADALAAATNSLVLLTNATWPTNTPVGTVAVDRGDFALTGVTLDGDGNVVVSSGFSSIPNAGKINISLAQVAALGVTTAGRSPAQIAEALAANGANGIPIWESYVLGLDPTKSDAKPKAMIVMNGDQVELALVGIDVNEAAGATVSYKVYKSADLSDLANVQPLDGDHALDEAASLQKSASEPKMFYRLVIDVKGY